MVKPTMLVTYFKGMMMGAADIIPGVSGGTIALITGIYEDLIFALSRLFDADTLRLLLKGQWRAWWQRINGRFLMSLMAGILTSVFLLAKIISWLFLHYPLMVWGFFFGLIAASGLFILNKWRIGRAADLLWVGMGASVAVFLAFMHPVGPVKGEVGWFFLLFSGALASIAMILPGISGSYILILIGMYRYVLDKVHQMEIFPLLVFTAGVGLGLGGFSRMLRWLFARYEHRTMLLLGGFLLGSLAMVWPWKTDLRPVWPSAYPGNPEIAAVLAWVIAGFLLIWGIEKIASRYGN
ncbi:MAG: DUF368 domain-containing protein [Chlorobi bacterium]|nr:DUF368 domain-containing protein [Chlorobiota bacterium]